MAEEKGDPATVVVSSVDPATLLVALQQRGYFTLPLSEELFNAQEEMFRQFDIFDARAFAEKAMFSLTPDAIGENNGWHGAGGLSRYNQCREGIIFQASSPVWPMLSGDSSAPPDDFSIAHENFRKETHCFAASIMEQLASALDLPQPATYFTENGPLDIIGGSQFHVKKVILSEKEDVSALHRIPEDDRYLTLRAHRDPSVISIVFHKHRSEESDHGLGLQFKDSDAGSFVNVTIDEGEVAGRAYCVVIAGSILELLSDGNIKAPLHRVVSTDKELRAADRVAATFFFQPELDSLLMPFSSLPSCTGDGSSCRKEETFISDGCNGNESVAQLKLTDKKKRGGVRGGADSGTPMTYGKWKSKAYGNYYKGK